MPGYLIETPSDDPSEDILGTATATQATAPASKPTEAVLDGDDIPEKYRGKTPKDLLQIVRDQESYIGRLGQEKGELRQRVGTLEGLVDKALHLRDPGVATQAPVGTEDDLKDIDFDRKPREAVAAVVRKELAPVRDQLADFSHKERALQFEREHPTAVNDLNDPAFVEFVKGSAYRARLATKAFGDPKSYDFEAAEELWSAWEEKRGASPPSNEPAATATEIPPTQDVAPPKLITPGSSGGASAQVSGKPVYSQEALERLQLSNPEKYWAPDVQARIQEAYREGRVVRAQPK